MPEEYMKKDFAVEVKVVEGERALNWTITTTKRDRAGDIIEAKGAKLANFRKNPVVLLAHDYKGLAIAKAEKLDKTDEKIMAKVIFPPEGDYPLADTVYKLYKGKFMRACSIGFIPIKSEDIVDEDDKDKDKESYRTSGRRIKTWELVEFSACAVGMNPDALDNQKMITKGIDIEPLKEAGFIEIEEEEGEDEKIEEGEAIKSEDVEKPYPNEHACRMRDPGDFKPDSFRRIPRVSDGKEYSIIMGRLKGETTLTEQAYRYGIKVWTVSEARKHCKDHKGIAFEPATGKEGGNEEDKDFNALIKSLEDIILALNVSEITKENKKLKEKIKELELKAGAVLNAKNKQDLKNAQKLNQDADALIQGVLDSAETNEDSLEIEDEKDSKDDDKVIGIEDGKGNNKVIDKEKNKDNIELDEKVIVKVIDETMGYILGKVKK